MDQHLPNKTITTLVKYQTHMFGQELAGQQITRNTKPLNTQCVRYSINQSEQMPHHRETNKQNECPIKYLNA